MRFFKFPVLFANKESKRKANNRSIVCHHLKEETRNDTMYEGVENSGYFAVEGHRLLETKKKRIQSLLSVETVKASGQI